MGEKFHRIADRFGQLVRAVARSSAERETSESAPQLRMLARFDEGIGEHSFPLVDYRLTQYDGTNPDEWVDLLNRSAEFGKWNRARLRAELLSLLIPEGGVFIEHEGQLVAGAAVCYARRFSPYALLNYAVVLPQYRRRRLGTVVTLKSMTVARAAGYPGMMLQTDDFRYAAIRTYLRLGFQPDIDVGNDSGIRWRRVLTKLETATP